METPQVLHLGIGELIVVDQPATITTILGSCVSVCLFSGAKRAGGMIHYALPSIESAHSSHSARGNDLRFGDVAIEALIQHYMRLTGEAAKLISAKLIGGASDLSGNKSSYDIGDQNIAMARKILARSGIKIVGEDVGGFTGRKVIFHVPSGRVQVARLNEAA